MQFRKKVWTCVGCVWLAVAGVHCGEETSLEDAEDSLSEASEAQPGAEGGGFPVGEPETDPAGEGVPSLEDSESSSDGEETAFPDAESSEAEQEPSDGESELEEGRIAPGSKKVETRLPEEGGDEPIGRG